MQKILLLKPGHYVRVLFLFRIIIALDYSDYTKKKKHTFQKFRKMVKYMR